MDNEVHISSGGLRIEKNFITDDEILLQISNISDIRVMEGPKTKFQYWTLILLVVGVILCFMGEFSSRNYFFYKNHMAIWAIGVVLVVGESLYGLIVLIANSDRNKNYLCISMNSGKNYIMFCQSEDFLRKVIGVIEYCLNNQSVQNIKIDFKGCKVHNSPITIGERNKVHNENRNI